MRAPRTPPLVALALLMVMTLAACGSGNGQATNTTRPRVVTKRSTTTSTSTTVVETTTTGAPAAAPTTVKPKAAAPAAPRTTARPRTTSAPKTTPAPAPTPAPSVPNEAPRATMSATVSFSGGGQGWAAYLNLHDANNNAVAMGAQSDVGDAPSSGRPMVHANYVVAGRFDHAYGTTQLPAHESHRWDLRYYDGAGRAILFQDGTALLGVSIRFSGTIFYQTEVNVKVDGDSVDATFGNCVVGGTKPGGAAVQPNGQWNTRDFDFYRLDMQQTNDQAIVQGANMRGFGTASGMGGGNWHTVNPPAAAIGMIAEQG
jgi:hypothetical protein